jgi:signal transduction histidine kinase/uncharacterized membrane protein
MSAAEESAPVIGVWPRVAGMVVTTLVAITIGVLGDMGVVQLDPAPFLFLAVVYGTLRGGIVGGLLSAAFATAFAAFAVGRAPDGVTRSPLDFTSVAVLGLLLVAAVFVIWSTISLLQTRAEAAEAARSTAERRAALLTEDAARRAADAGDIGRRYEEVLQRAESEQDALNLLEAVLDSAPQGLGVVNREHEMVWWNRSLAKLAGLPEGSLRVKRGVAAIGEFLDSEQLSQVLVTGESVTRLVMAGQGVARPYVLQYYPVETVRGERLVGVMVAQAFTGAGEAERAGERASERAGERGSAPAGTAPPTGTMAPFQPQPEFLDADVLDTLRAPLAAIREYVWFMVAGPDEPRRRAGDGFGSRVLGAAQQMDDRIEGLAEFARAARGRVHLEPVPVGEVVEVSLRRVEREVTASGARLRVVVDPEAGCVLADRVLLTSALEHLVSNAIKYVPSDAQPRVQVTASPVPSKGVVRIEVEDNGIGIQKDDEARLFRLFERLPEAEAYPGNGVGLAVVKASVERMGGSVGVSSEPAWGSRFWIEIPVASTPAATPALTAPQSALQ